MAGYNGYPLDSHREINMLSLTWNDSFSSISLTKQELSLEECLQAVEDVLTVLESTTTKGFLPGYDLTTFPIVSEILPALIKGKGTQYLRGEKSMESYKWVYNIVILNLYLLCIETISKSDMIVELTDQNLIVDLKVKEGELYAMLDPSIRHHIQKRGISVKENTYIGFDTEFTNKDLDHNELVSVQLAVTTKLYVKIPKCNAYIISTIDAKTNKLLKQQTSSVDFNYQKVEMSIQKVINSIRQKKYAKHDRSMLALSESLKVIKGLKYTDQDECIIFSLPRSLIQPYIHYGNSFSLQEVIQISSGIAKEHHAKSNVVLMALIREITSTDITPLLGVENTELELSKKYEEFKDIAEIKSGLEERLPLLTEYCTEEDLSEKRLSRKYYKDLFPQPVSVTKSKNYYLIAHLTPADLSLLSDFDQIKEDLSIVNGSFVTIGKALRYCGRNVHIRDTMLLAPGASKSLASIGKLYGGVLNKIEISKTDLEDMKGFLARDKAKFTEYALRDAIISLIHASWMEDFNFNIGVVGIPLSLSSLGRNYVKAKWREESYSGYQISSKYLLGDVASTITPKGLNVIKDIGFVLPYYIFNYKGGRNECYMYGIDRDTEWFDYDLTNAYTTVMSMAGHPDYERCIRLNVSDLQRLTRDEILYSYLIINADFEFPVGTKYPSIPCYVDENCTVYPLKGSCVITGAEYLLALEQKCSIKVHDIIFTPFKTSEHRDHKPFAQILKEVQEQRREHAKGTLSNLMYKELGNGIYGSVVRGIGNKRKFDIKSKGSVRMQGDSLSNPLIASWTTAFIRSIIGECLHAIQTLGGLAVSATTDGFVTDMKDLEGKLSEYLLFAEYKKIRMHLSGDNTGLELKSSGVGIIAWSTRGQLGIGSRIIATTGFQHRAYANKDLLVKGFMESVKTEHKTIGFIQSRLRSATDIYKQGGHVTMIQRDQLFRLHYDNRRVLQWESSIPSSIEKLIDSLPLDDVTQGKNLRCIARMSKARLYSKYSGGTSGSKATPYKSNVDVAVRKFLKGLLSTPPCFNLHRGGLSTYPLIIEYLQNYNTTLIYKESTLAVIKHRCKKVKWLPLTPSKESEDLVRYIQQKFANFAVEEYYSKS